MKFSRAISLAIAAVFAAGALVVAMPVAADKEVEAYHRDYIYGAPSDPSDAWVAARGGRLYDNWINTLEKEKPKATHSAWPASFGGSSYAKPNHNYLPDDCRASGKCGDELEC